LEKAGRLVLAGKGVAGNAGWATAYGEVVKAVERDPLYAGTKELPFKPEAAEKGTHVARQSG